MAFFPTYIAAVVRKLQADGFMKPLYVCCFCLTRIVVPEASIKRWIRLSSHELDNLQKKQRIRSTLYVIEMQKIIAMSVHVQMFVFMMRHDARVYQFWWGKGGNT